MRPSLDESLINPSMDARSRSASSACSAARCCTPEVVSDRTLGTGMPTSSALLRELTQWNSPHRRARAAALAALANECPRLALAAPFHATEQRGRERPRHSRSRSRIPHERHRTTALRPRSSRTPGSGTPAARSLGDSQAEAKVRLDSTPYWLRSAGRIRSWRGVLVQDAARLCGFGITGGAVAVWRGCDDGLMNVLPSGPA